MLAEDLRCLSPLPCLVRLLFARHLNPLRVLGLASLLLRGIRNLALRRMLRALLDLGILDDLNGLGGLLSLCLQVGLDRF